MQANEKHSIPLFFSDKHEEIKKVFNNLKEENHRLQLENDQFKRELEREQTLHKTLYNEWKELKSGITVKKNGPRKIRRFVRKKSSSYGLFAIAISLSALFVYLIFSDRAGNTISPQIPAPNLADTVATDTISKNKIQVSGHKSPIPKPTIKSKRKKSTIYSLNKNIDSSYQNKSVTKNESAGSLKTDSTFAVSSRHNQGN